MQKNNDKKVPKLRFPGFDGDWEVKMLGDLLSFKNGINASKEQYGKGYKFINVLDIINNDFIFHDRIIGKVDVSEKAFQKSLVSYGDILFQRSSETREEVGQSNVYLDKEHTATFGGFVIRGQKIAPYDPKYLHYILKTQKVRKQIMVHSGGSTRYNVSQSILRAVPLYITPYKEEQQKIANFLSSIDKKISLLEQKTEQLEAFKKGTIQQLLTGKKRFKEFVQKEGFKETKLGMIPKDWEVVKLGTVGEIVSGLTYKPTNVVDEGLLVLRSSNIQKGHLCYKNTVYVNLKEGDYNPVEEQDILICVRNGSKKLIGKNTLIDKKASGHAFGAFMSVFRSTENLYIQFIFKTNLYRKSIRANLGATINSINSKNLKNMLIPWPSLPEQKKIADCLSSIDQQIQGSRAQLAATKTYKKGLLQQLLV